MKALTSFAAAVSIALAAGPALAQGAAKPAPQPPAGQYHMDKAHSNYTAQFAKVDGKLQFDPANPAAMKVEASIDPTSLVLNAPPAGFLDKMLGKEFFDAAQFPKMTFVSTKVEATGPKTAKVTGDFTLHGVTKPVTLDVTYNGGYPPNSFDPGGARVGFSAHGVLKRSAFGMGFGVPAPGSTMGVSDEVDFAIETEFSSKPSAE
jgi:polyisoprenoid-binding protein YceI